MAAASPVLVGTKHVARGAVGGVQPWETVVDGAWWRWWPAAWPRSPEPDPAPDTAVVALPGAEPQPAQREGDHTGYRQQRPPAPDTSAYRRGGAGVPSVHFPPRARTRTVRASRGLRTVSCSTSVAVKPAW